MAKIIRPIVGIIAIVAIALAGRHIYHQRTVGGDVVKVDEEYSKAKTLEDFQRVKQSYEALLPKATTDSVRKVIEGQIAGCDAWAAFMVTSGRPSIRGYEGCIKKMEKAKELTGDQQGVWSKKLTEFRMRHKEAMGPDIKKMRSEYARLSGMPFAKAMGDLETLFRWRQIWHDQDMYKSDKEREEVFAKTRKLLFENYCRRFEASIAKARKTKGKSEEALSIRSAPLGALSQVGRFDKAKTDAYAKKYAKDLAAAKVAQKELEKLMEAQMGM